MAPESSGTPGSLLEMLRRGGALAVFDEIAENQVLIEYPFSESWREETGCKRFVRLRQPIDGFEYALIRGARAAAEG